MKARSPRNKTLFITEEEKRELGRRVFNTRRLPEHFTDCTICADLLRIIDKIPNHCADLIIVDPPYNLNKQFGSSHFHAISDEEYRTFVRSWLPGVIEKLKPDGSLYICGDWRSSVVLYDELRPLHVLNRITWQREKGRGAMRNWKNGMEDIWFAVADKENYHFDVDAVKQRRRVLAPYKANGMPKDWEQTENGNFRNTFPSNFWDDISIPYWSMKENTVHPTQKPEKLIAKLILASSAPGDLVFDPFVGSGTTSVVAKKLGRHYLGIERDKTYACITEKRLALAEKDKTIQGYADGVFWERNTAAYQK